MEKKNTECLINNSTKIMERSNNIESTINFTYEQETNITLPQPACEHKHIGLHLHPREITSGCGRK